VTKDAGILVALPRDLKEWVDAQAEDIGVNAEIWIRMLVFAARKGRASVSPPSLPRIAAPVPAAESTVLEWQEGVQPLYGDPDAWRGPVDDDSRGETSGVDIDAMIAARVADADAAGAFAPPSPPIEMFGRPPAEYGVGGVRSLHRPPVPFTAGNQPHHLRVFG
jgi:hypothetical protein